MDKSIYALFLIVVILSVVVVAVSWIQFLISKKTFETIRSVTEVMIKDHGANSDILGRIETTTNSTHVLVNSNMEAQLLINLATTRRLASLTKNPEDERIAEAAKSAYENHINSQSKADKI